jgi:DNA primase
MKIHRISLEAEAYARLAYIAALEQISPKDWMEERIKDAWDHRDESPIIQLDDKPKCGAATVADIPQKRKRLADNPDALQQIKTLWAEGVHNGTEIAKRINYPKATVAEHIKKLKERGELVD